MIKVFLSLSLVVNILLIMAILYNVVDEGVTNTYQNDGLVFDIEKELNNILAKDSLSKESFKSLQSEHLRIVFDGTDFKKIEIVRKN